MTDKTDPLFAIQPTSALFPPDGTDYRALRGIPLDQMCNGALAFNGVNLSTGYGDENDDTLLVDQKPVELNHVSFPLTRADQYVRNCHYFSTVVKRMGITDGKVTIYIQPAVNTSRQ